MTKILQKKNLKKEKIIAVSFDAAFYSDRSIQSWDRQEYDKALKYCALAIAKDKDNPIYHYNLATIQAEIGQFDASNKTLLGILKNIDPTMSDCFYYMANNYAHLDNLIKSEEYLIKYLEADADGIFVEEAREMLCKVSEELGRDSEDFDSIPEIPCMEDHDMACTLLEAGDYYKAIDYLIPITESHEEFLPAWNNLSLAYYYAEKFEFALICINHVLENDPNNITALCNLALIYKELGKQEEVDQLVDSLINVVPLDNDLTYKLANSLGLLGQDKKAYILLKGLLKCMEPPNIYIYHYLAVASTNLGDLDKALHYWNKANKLEPTNDIVNCHIDLAQRVWSKNEKNQRLIYGFFLPFEELLLYKQPQKFLTKLVASLQAYDNICASYSWATEKGNCETKEKIQQLACAVPKSKLSKALKPFTQVRSKYSDSSKHIALSLILTAEREAALKRENRVINLKPS